MVLAGFFFFTKVVKPVGEAIGSIYCTIQQPQKTELAISQEQEKPIKKTSLVAKIDDIGFRVQVENTTSHCLFDVECERCFRKVTAQMGLRAEVTLACYKQMSSAGLFRMIKKKNKRKR